MVARDWGAYVAFLFLTAHPDCVESFVCLDVGMVTPTALGVAPALVVACYQAWLAAVFVLSQVFAGVPLLQVVEVECWRVRAWGEWRWGYVGRDIMVFSGVGLCPVAFGLCGAG